MIPHFVPGIQMGLALAHHLLGLRQAVAAVGESVLGHVEGVAVPCLVAVAVVMACLAVDAEEGDLGVADAEEGVVGEVACLGEGVVGVVAAAVGVGVVAAVVQVVVVVAAVVVVVVAAAVVVVVVGEEEGVVVGVANPKLFFNGYDIWLFLYKWLSSLWSAALPSVQFFSCVIGNIWLNIRI